MKMWNTSAYDQIVRLRLGFSEKEYLRSWQRWSSFLIFRTVCFGLRWRLGGKSDGIKEEKHGNVSLEAELPDQELASGNNECTSGAECGILSSLC